MRSECRIGTWRRWSTVAVATAVCCALPAGSAAQELSASDGRWIQDRRGEFRSADRLAVRVRGDITVSGTPREGIRYAAKLLARTPGEGTEWVRAALGSLGLESLEREDGTLELSLREPDCAGCRVVANVEIEVPDHIDEVDLRTEGGDIRVHGVAGSVRASAFRGSVRMDSIGSAVTATAAGSIRLGAVGGPVDCETAAGRIELGRASGSARLRTNVGSVRVESVDGTLDAQTGAGSIQIGRVSGAVRLATTSGSIQVSEAFNGVEAHVGAGDIRIHRTSGALNLTSGAGNIAIALREGAIMRDSVLSTAVGSVFVSVPESLALTVEAAVRMIQGRQGIVSDFPSIRVRRLPGVLGGAQANGSINGGGAVLRSGTGIGQIEIRRRR